MRLRKLLTMTLWTQGIYTGSTALWGIIDIDSFQAVTGPKTDLWLVKTVSVVLLAIGISFIMQALRPGNPLPIMLLAILSSAGLATIDMYYAFRDVISPVYLADAVVEIIFFISWVILLVNVKALIKDQPG